MAKRWGPDHKKPHRWTGESRPHLRPPAVPAGATLCCTADPPEQGKEGGHAAAADIRSWPPRGSATPMRMRLEGCSRRPLPHRERGREREEIVGTHLRGERRRRGLPVQTHPRGEQRGRERGWPSAMPRLAPIAVLVAPGGNIGKRTEEERSFWFPPAREGAQPRRRPPAGPGRFAATRSEAPMAPRVSSGQTQSWSRGERGRERTRGWGRERWRCRYAASGQPDELAAAPAATLGSQAR